METLGVSLPCVQQIGHAAYADHRPLVGVRSSNLRVRIVSDVATAGDQRSSSLLLGLGCDWAISRNEIKEEARAQRQPEDIRGGG
jgi:hypothetical protein